ncbi:hypothetical protein B6A42_27505 (plasmid) [Vibrio coralliilyticus]|nr:hypothetical protein B6A42_27505 [Vibrio coralliilyticus]
MVNGTKKNIKLTQSTAGKKSAFSVGDEHAIHGVILTKKNTMDFRLSKHYVSMLMWKLTIF